MDITSTLFPCASVTSTRVSTPNHLQFITLQNNWRINVAKIVCTPLFDSPLYSFYSYRERVLKCNERLDAFYIISQNNHTPE